MSCSESTTYTASPKALKLSTVSSSDDLIQLKHSYPLKPIPIIYQKIQKKGKDNWRMIPKIAVKGYKNISRVAATGESTIEMLDKLKKSSTIKSIRNLEFDPYFCEDSGLKSLSKVFKKLKRNISSLTLVIRRFVKKDNIEEFCASLARLKNLVKLKLELTSIEGLDSMQIRQISTACVKCSLLKSFDLKIVEVPCHYQKDCHLARYLPWLEHLGQFFQSSQTLDNRVTRTDTLKKVRRLKKFKSCKLKVSSKTTWASYSDGMKPKQVLPPFLKVLAEAMNPIYLSFTFEGFPLSSSFLNVFTNTLPQMTNLRFMHLELSNTNLSEFDLMLFANCFLNSKQIQNLTFKYLSKSIISVMDVLQFILILAKYAKLSKLDLFLRKILYEEWDSPEITSQLENIENTTYQMTKQSIHVQKIKSLEISEIMGF